MLESSLIQILDSHHAKARVVIVIFVSFVLYVIYKAIYNPLKTFLLSLLQKDNINHFSNYPVPLVLDLRIPVVEVNRAEFFGFLLIPFMVHSYPSSV